MKKIILYLPIITLIACGPNAEQKAAAEKAKTDSIANVAAKELNMVKLNLWVKTVKMNIVYLIITMVVLLI